MKELLTTQQYIFVIFKCLLCVAAIAEFFYFCYSEKEFVKQCISNVETSPSIKRLMAFMILKVIIELSFAMVLLGIGDFLSLIITFLGFICTLMGLNTMEKKFQNNIPAEPKKDTDETPN